MLILNTTKINNIMKERKKHTEAKIVKRIERKESRKNKER